MNHYIQSIVVIIAIVAGFLSWNNNQDSPKTYHECECTIVAYFPLKDAEFTYSTTFTPKKGVTGVIGNTRRLCRNFAVKHKPFDYPDGLTPLRHVRSTTFTVDGEYY